ncbi:MAG: hypothetical protein IKH93_05475 [Bacteroidales bacterium]|nr:hypothetical protein [Bacteroidales bacterium]
MIYDKKTQRYYLNDFHLKNSELSEESLKNQKPFSREEMIAQYQKNLKRKRAMLKKENDKNNS